MTKATQTAPIQFKRVAAVSLPLLAINYGKDGAPISHFLKFETPFVEHKSSKEDAKDMMVSTATNLVTGEQGMVYFHPNMAVKFTQGKAYEIVCSKPAGKRYPEFAIYEIEA